ncbi:hypothetical protein [Halomonas sp. Mc5H-6]|uniref:tetratricopeptide repeat protein n=1 Tax=Halomonas sp. Mc5H-6 TaxID=2954500 RepID=UPI00209791C8|nr:hypothetical protein [Halomonas sp. Mc5H-6]MCO7244994.1 hypothetical protein [Halomonas sp. Mc5H-6]
MADKNVKQVSFEIDLKNQIMVGTSDNEAPIDHDIGRKIADSISRSLENSSNEWLNQFDKNIENKEYLKAYDLFDENKWTLQFCVDKGVVNKLRRMDVSKLDNDFRKEYLTFLIALSSHLGVRENLLQDIDNILFNHEKELDPVLVQNLYLEKANISAINGFSNKAVLLYKKIILSNDSDSATIAWAYQGLSKLTETEEDKIRYAEKAADKHLEAGSRDEAVKNFLKISDIKSVNNPEAAVNIIDRCIDLYGSEKLIDRELLASIKHKKASYFQRIGRYLDALPIVEEACDLRRGLIGCESELHASLILAEVVANANGESDKAKDLNSEHERLSHIISDDNFSLRCEISEIISRSGVIDEVLLSKVISSDDRSMLASVLLYQSTNSCLNLEESLELLDRSRLIVESQRDKRILDIIFFSIAEKYRVEDMIDDAYSYYKKSLESNQFYHPSAQNCAAMLINEKRWKDAEEFFKDRMVLVGELPGICFGYARALYENRKYSLAFKYFKKSDPYVDGLSDYISACLENVDDAGIALGGGDNNAIEKVITAEQFYCALEEFSYSVSADTRMHFWVRDKEIGKYKWTKNPEELSKQMLITFLNGKFGKETIDILQEQRAGAGFIDLYVMLPGGLKVVIELKMCGGGYSSNYALSGESQIIHYQTNKFTKIGYLVVFDARARDYGKGLRKLQVVNGHTIYSLAIDMRPQIIKK